MENKKIYFITSLELDDKYKDLSDLEVLDDEDYKNYIKQNGNVFTFKEFALLALAGEFYIPTDDNERYNSISYRIL